MVKRNLATIHAAGALLCLALGLAGCASDAPQVQTAPPVESAAYVPDPNDPLSRWVPHIREASKRYDMPEKWIRAVMMRESNGRATTNSGKVLTSSAGAIGLMQVMPGTYELMRAKYGLGSDPSDPHENIMAGTAYLREMYDLFGAPGFLAAYNCGPACYAQHLAGKQRLPRETKMYLAALTPVQREIVLFYGYVEPGVEGVVLCCDNARHYNFSGDPNSGSDERWKNGARPTYALRDIAEGEELTFAVDEDDDAARKLGDVYGVLARGGA